MSKKRTGKALEKWRLEQIKAIELKLMKEKKREDQYGKVLEAIQAGKDQERKQIEKMKSQLGKVQTVKVKLTDEYYEPPTKAPSDKQMDFIRSLADQIHRNGGTFNMDPLDAGLDMWHTGFVITDLIQIKNLPPIKSEGYTIEYDLAGFVESIKDLKAGFYQTTVPCNYTLKQKVA